jgi:hypothetical protein
VTVFEWSLPPPLHPAMMIRIAAKNGAKRFIVVSLRLNWFCALSLLLGQKVWQNPG